MVEIEHETKDRLRREEAAERLRYLADQISRQNAVTFIRGGIVHTVKVPDEVELEVEIEVGEDESKVEVEISW